MPLLSSCSSPEMELYFPFLNAILSQGFFFFSFFSFSTWSSLKRVVGTTDGGRFTVFNHLFPCSSSRAQQLLVNQRIQAADNNVSSIHQIASGNKQTTNM